MVATAFKNIDARATLITGLELQAQCSGRRLLECALRPEQEGQFCTALSGYLQPAKPGEADLFRPGQHRTTPTAPKRLFAGPQRVFTAAHHQ